MNDFFKQSREQQEINENLFNRLLGKKTPITPPAQTNKDFYKTPNGMFLFGGKNVAKELNVDAELPLSNDEFDLRNSKLNFMLLPGTKFEAEKITIDLKKQIITFFKGFWESGPFIGQTFQGTFDGSSFQGNFYSRYTDYESHPTTFVNGTFRDTTNKGILGMPNTITLNKAKNRKFNLITIPVGYYLQFRSVNGITGYIKVLKRLDATNSDFRFEVLDGFAGETSPNIVPLTWDYMRQNWNSLLINPKNPRNFAGIINVPDGDAIKEMYVSVAPATFITPAAAPVANPAVTPVVTPPASNNPGMTAGQIAQSFLPEGIRKVVRNIISDNL